MVGLADDVGVLRVGSMLTGSPACGIQRRDRPAGGMCSWADVDGSPAGGPCPPALSGSLAAAAEGLDPRDLRAVELVDGSQELRDRVQFLFGETVVERLGLRR